jgi:UDP-hydrolysing UDP-N-acetyl-D-glucosamine 2-epimerase
LLNRDPAFELCLMVGGMHLSDAFGGTARFIEADEVPVVEQLDWIGESDVASQSAMAITSVAAALSRQRPDCLVLVGDRFETMAAALAATLECVPIVHLHGGEETQGAIDNVLRNAITKMSHLHLVSHPDHAARVIAMGEDPAIVHVVGAPGLDNAHRSDLPDRAELSKSLGIELVPPVVIVTLHPATLGGGADDARAVVDAMDRVPATYVITLPNTDTGHEVVRAKLQAASNGPRRVAVDALGERRFWGLMRAADAMLGNSSSAIIEAPVCRLPVVNVGDRQLGRLRGDNVIDVPGDTNRVAAALLTALDMGKRAALSGTSPYGDGHAAPRIVDVLKAWTPPNPPRKRGVQL